MRRCPGQSVGKALPPVAIGNILGGIALQTVVLAGTQLPDGLLLAPLTPDVVLIAVFWLAGLLLVQRVAETGLVEAENS